MAKKVFISHGHDAFTKSKLKDFIRDRLKLEPVVLSEQPDLGLTIIEKLEHYGKDCDFALILLSADDQTPTGGFRARQNVIHELGYYHALLGRNRVLLLKEIDVELFSNISGLIYKEFPKGSIESVFEDIRLAIECGDASKHAMSVPRKEEEENRNIAHEVVEEFNKAVPLIAKHEKEMLCSKLRSLPGTLPAKVRLQRIRNLLETNYQLWKTRGTQDDEEICRAGSNHSEVLGRVMHIAIRAQIEELERSFLECLDVLKSWESSGEKNLAWLPDATSEIYAILERENREA